MKLIVLDPGESTGYLVLKINDDRYRIVEGGTIPKEHIKVFETIIGSNPDLIIYETFHMYPGKAKALSWNSFYPCEVIGVIKLVASMHSIDLVGLAPSTKKYAGGFENPIWKDFRSKNEYTEHTKDAWLLFQYWFRNKR